MLGINLDMPISYLHSSLRFFDVNEHHVDRICEDDVLLLVFKGVLRFNEDGEDFEIAAGQYHIQRHGSTQRGVYASDSPEYLYVHFYGEWDDGANILPCSGIFNYSVLRSSMERLDEIAHKDYTLTERTAVFTEILSLLYRSQKPHTPARMIAEYLEEHLTEDISLDRLSDEFNYSKNHIINIFKSEFSQTPTEYLNGLRIKRAMHLLESTSLSTEKTAESSGFHNYSHFYRLFIRVNGSSPSEWRKQMRLFRGSE